MIVLVAPYTGYNKSGEVFLGASKKIRFILSVFSKLSNNILLVNSAHNAEQKETFIIRDIEIDGISVKEIILPTAQKKQIGKLLNLFHIGETLKLIDTRFSESPALFWFYNAYAFEMVFAKNAFKKFGAPMILEFEDWHFTRDRKASLKPWIDYMFWRSTTHLFTRVYAINAKVRDKVIPLCPNVSLLPGVVPEDLVGMSIAHPPLLEGNKQINIGYFGGLKQEKGADIVLALSKLLPDNFVMHATGTGPMASEFAKRYSEAPNRLKYHGMVSDEELNTIIAKCDIILNPHKPMTEFNDGLFPFKVIEAIASGRMLITTNVSFIGFEGLSRGVKFVEHSVEAFAAAIQEAPEWYFKNKYEIRSASSHAVELFGPDSIVNYLRTLLKEHQLKRKRI